MLLIRYNKSETTHVTRTSSLSKSKYSVRSLSLCLMITPVQALRNPQQCLITFSIGDAPGFLMQHLKSMILALPRTRWSLFAEFSLYPRESLVNKCVQSRSKTPLVVDPLGGRSGARRTSLLNNKWRETAEDDFMANPQVSYRKSRFWWGPPFPCVSIGL